MQCFFIIFTLFFNKIHTIMTKMCYSVISKLKDLDGRCFVRGVLRIDAVLYRRCFGNNQ